MMLVANCELGRSERAYRIVIIKADKVLRSCRSKRRRKAYWREKKINRKIKKKKRPEMGGNEQSEPVGPSEHLGLIHDKNFLFFKKNKKKTLGTWKRPAFHKVWQAFHRSKGTVVGAIL